MTQRQKSYYVVESIVDSKTDENSQKLYLIKWQGWDHLDNTWEPLNHLNKIQKYVDQFQRKNQSVHCNKKQFIVRDQPFIITKIRRKRKTIMKTAGDTDPTKEKKKTRKIHADSTDKSQIKKRGPGRPPKKIIQKAHEIPVVHQIPVGLQITQAEIIDEIQNRLREIQQQVPIQKEINLPIQQSNKERCEYQGNNVELDESEQHQLVQQPYIQIQHEQNLQFVIQNPPRRNRLGRIYTHEARKSKRIQLKKESKDLQTFEGQHIISEQDDEQQQSLPSDVQIEQILSNNMNYNDVTVTSQEGKLQYQIPYTKNSQTVYLKVTGEEILKISPNWLVGFFEGFYC